MFNIKMYQFLLLLFLFFLQCMSLLSAKSIELSFEPSAIYVDEDGTKSIHYNLTGDNHELLGIYRFVVKDDSIARVVNNDPFIISPNNVSEENVYISSIQIKGIFLGYTTVHLERKGSKEENFKKLKSELKVGVFRAKEAAADAFKFLVICIIVLMYYSMGTTIDLGLIKEVIKMPISPAIGLISQYLVLPIISFFIGWLLFEEKYYRLGLFVFGCSPGGGSSNIWTVMIGGNLNLSITMTFISTFFSMAAMPFWLYTLGSMIFEDTSAKPDIISVVSSVIIMFASLIVGYLVNKFLPNISKTLDKIFIWIFRILGLCIIVVGIYSNRYIFNLLTFRISLACLANVVIGSAIGFLLGKTFRRPTMDAVTIAIETGVQNQGVAITILAVSITQQPDSDLAASIPLIATFFTNFSLLGLLIFFKIRRRYYGEQSLTEYTIEDVHDKTEIVDHESKISTLQRSNFKFDEEVIRNEFKYTSEFGSS